MELFYRQEGSGKTVVVLHGLFGMSDNWLTVGRKLAENFRVIMVDLRNHGKSPHNDEWNYTCMVNDLLLLVKNLQLERFYLIGHSMGGKVAMKFAQTHPELLEKLVIIDIAPKYYHVHHQKILKALHAVKLNELASRGEAEVQLNEHIEEWGVKQFLLKNLGRDTKGFYWKFNLKVISKHIENVGEATNLKKCDVPTLFIRGSESDYILNSDSEEIKSLFTNSFILTIKKAGHWVHADQPEALLTSIEQYFEYKAT